jgi:hypothetical protein
MFPSRPIYLLASAEASAFICGIRDIPQYVTIISLDRQLMCAIKFQFYMPFLGIPNGVF